MKAKQHLFNYLFMLILTLNFWGGLTAESMLEHGVLLVKLLFALLMVFF